MKLRTEIYTNENGVEMQCVCFGHIDEDGNEVVTGKIETPNVMPEPTEPELTTDPVMEKLESIEAKIQTNEDLQIFYDDIVKEVGL